MTPEQLKLKELWFSWQLRTDWTYSGVQFVLHDPREADGDCILPGIFQGIWKTLADHAVKVASDYGSEMITDHLQNKIRVQVVEKMNDPSFRRQIWSCMTYALLDKHTLEYVLLTPTLGTDRCTSLLHMCLDSPGNVDIYPFVDRLISEYVVRPNKTWAVKLVRQRTDHTFVEVTATDIQEAQDKARQLADFHTPADHKWSHTEVDVYVDNIYDASVEPETPTEP